MNARAVIDHVAKARRCWRHVPDWVAALAELCNAEGVSGAAAITGLSGSSISRLLGNDYPASTCRAAEKVRLALDLAAVSCPVLGEIRQTECVRHQQRGRSTANPLHVALSRACPTCPHGTLRRAGKRRGKAV